MTLTLSSTSHSIVEFNLILKTQWTYQVRQAICRIILLQFIHSSLYTQVEKLIQQQHPDLPPLKNVHQIDYATSGIYVQALTRKAAAKVCKLFEQRQVEKTYLAIVRGHMIPDLLSAGTTSSPPPIVVDQPIDNDPSHPFRMAILPSGKPSFTTIQVLEQGYYYPSSQNPELRIPVTKVALYPKTGKLR